MRELTSHQWFQSRPSLVIERCGGASLGNCYCASYFRVTSTQPLSKEDLSALRLIGLLGCGQEFIANYITCDGKKEQLPIKVDWKTIIEPTGVDVVQCVEVDNKTGKPTSDEPAICPYTEKPYPPHKIPYFIYECESRADSSD